jgi:hypothetical protein
MGGVVGGASERAPCGVGLSAVSRAAVRTMNLLPVRSGARGQCRVANLAMTRKARHEGVVSMGVYLAPLQSVDKREPALSTGAPNSGSSLYM